MLFSKILTVSYLLNIPQLRTRWPFTHVSARDSPDLLDAGKTYYKLDIEKILKLSA
jgi:hypothetical protein